MMALDDLDFTNHMEEIRKMEAKRERNEAMVNAHEVMHPHRLTLVLFSTSNNKLCLNMFRFGKGLR